MRPISSYGLLDICNSKGSYQCTAAETQLAKHDMLMARTARTYHQRLLALQKESESVLADVMVERLSLL
jgi:hypothetical protein